MDSFHGFDKAELLDRFVKETYQAIDEKISLNPILNSFQEVVHKYKIEMELINLFLESMKMDLSEVDYDQKGFEKYILGSAEVVGLMCLRVFVEGDTEKYSSLKESAMKLGSAFQKINFLRDIDADYKELGRSYFPNLEIEEFSPSSKAQIEQDIQADFRDALEGIKRLPQGAKLGVYTAYIYYYALFKKICATNSDRILEERIRIPNWQKFLLAVRSCVFTRLRII